MDNKPETNEFSIVYSDKIEDRLKQWIKNPKERKQFLIDHPNLETAELIRIASSGKGRPKPHWSGIPNGSHDEILQTKEGAKGVPRAKRKVKHIPPFKIGH